MRRLELVLVAVVLISTGCGAAGAAPPTSTRGPAEQLLTSTDVDRYPGGTPARALLTWWRNAQFANLTAFVDGFDESMRRRLRTSPRLGEALNQFAAAIRTARPTILDVTRMGDTATVYTLVIQRRPLGVKRYVASSAPQAFEMIRQAGHWRLRDDGFVQMTLPPELRRPV